MVASEVVIIIGALGIGVYSALRQYSWVDHAITAVSFVGYSMPIFFIALLSMYIFGVLFKRWGLPYLPTVGMFDPEQGKTVGQVMLHMILASIKYLADQLCRVQPVYRSTMLEVTGAGLYPHSES